MGLVRALLAIGTSAFALLLVDIPGCGARDGLPQGDAGHGRDAKKDGPIEQSCGIFPVQADPSELEVFIAMDTSGSMKDEISSGLPKLEAVRSALKGFLNDPGSSGIGVSIAFFPALRANVPSLCTSDESCGAKDACRSLLSCLPNSLEPCEVSADCPSGETCEPLGVCGTTPQAFCAPGYSCDWGEKCLPGGWCENRTICDATDYEPDAPVSRLPQGVPEMEELLDLKEAKGGTPTLPAIQGAIHAATARQEQNRKVKTIVLLATDGFPTLCDPAVVTPYEKSTAGIPKVASEAEAGLKNGVQTFVIGVFTPLEAAMAQTNLNAIALAGGGAPTAYVITTDQAVTAKFLAALNQIRNSATACDYVLPQPDGVPLDAKHLKVRIRTSKKTVWPPLRTSLAKCDSKDGGFVFDRDPFGPERPSRIQLCPASCALVDADDKSEVEVIVAC